MVGKPICMRTLLVLFAITFFPIALSAQKIKRVEGEYIYRAPENVTLEQAKRTALERAQLEALAEAFGTNIRQQNSTRVENSNGKSDINFLSISSSDVKGEWIETIDEPQYHITYEQSMLVVSCKVKGRAREITSAVIDLKAKILRNGTEDRFESTEFRDGDDLYLSFQSPVDGYLAVYLLDANGDAFCLLPYRNQTDGVQRIKANTPYIFFSKQDVPLTEHSIVDEYVMGCESGSETNHIYTIFSPSPFNKAIDTAIDSNIPRELDGEKFQRWLAKVKERDAEVQVDIEEIMIKPE